MKKKTVTLKNYIMAISIFLIALVVGIFIFYSGVQQFDRKKFSGANFYKCVTSE